MTGWLNPPGDRTFRLEDKALATFLRTVAEKVPPAHDFRCGRCEDVVHSAQSGFRHLWMAHPELLPPSLSSDAKPEEPRT